MMRWRALAALAAGLSGVLALECGAPEPMPDVAAPPAAAAAQAAAAAADTALPNALAPRLLDRPLFSPDRRLAAPEPPAAAEAAAADLPRLAGVIVGPGRRSAIFTDGAGQPRIAGEGASIGRFHRARDRSRAGNRDIIRRRKRAAPLVCRCEGAGLRQVPRTRVRFGAVTLRFVRRGLLTLLAAGSLGACEHPTEACPAGLGDIGGGAGRGAAHERRPGCGRPAARRIFHRHAGGSRRYRGWPRRPAPFRSTSPTPTSVRSPRRSSAACCMSTTHRSGRAWHGDAAYGATADRTAIAAGTAMLLGNAGATLVPDQGMFRHRQHRRRRRVGQRGHAAALRLGRRTGEGAAAAHRPQRQGRRRNRPERAARRRRSAQVQAVRDLVSTFDADELAHQSYAVLPVGDGSARDFAERCRSLLRGASAAARRAGPGRPGAGGAADAVQRGADHLIPGHAISRRRAGFMA